MKCFIAVFREQETGLIQSINTKEDSIFCAEKLMQILEMDNDPNYIKEQLFICTDYDLYLKKRLEVKVAELKNYSQHIEYYMTNHDFIDEEVKEDTRKLMEDYEKTLMKQVAIRCSQCLLHEIEVTDEIALQCYDLRESDKI